MLDSVVTGYENLISTITLPDTNDRHVLATAIHTNAHSIVTFNLKDFPEEALNIYKIKAIHPNDFIVDLIDIDIGAVIDSVKKHRASLKNPEFSPENYLECLLKQKLFQTVSLLDRHKKYI